MNVWDEEKTGKNEQLFVVFFDEEEGDSIRIISARKLTRADKKSLGWLRLGGDATHFS